MTTTSKAETAGVTLAISDSTAPPPQQLTSAELDGASGGVAASPDLRHILPVTGPHIIGSGHPGLPQPKSSDGQLV